MKGKKKEEVDFATLPKANMIAASLILGGYLSFLSRA